MSGLEGQSVSVIAGDEPSNEVQRGDSDAIFWSIYSEFSDQQQQILKVKWLDELIWNSLPKSDFAKYIKIARRESPSPGASHSPKSQDDAALHLATRVYGTVSTQERSLYSESSAPSTHGALIAFEAATHHYLQQSRQQKRSLTIPSLIIHVKLLPRSPATTD